MARKGAEQANNTSILMLVENALSLSLYLLAGGEESVTQLEYGAATVRTRRDQVESASILILVENLPPPKGGREGRFSNHMGMDVFSPCTHHVLSVFSWCSHLALIVCNFSTSGKQGRGGDF